MYILRLTMVGCIKESQNDMMELCRNTAKDIKLCRINLVYFYAFSISKKLFRLISSLSFIVLSIIIPTIVRFTTYYYIKNCFIIISFIQIFFQLCIMPIFLKIQIKTSSSSNSSKSN